MFSEGYIGFTSRTVELRWKHHLKESRRSRAINYPVYNAIRKYGGALVVTTILEGPNDYCLDVEHKLRPEMKIGWNIQMGGNKGTKGIDVTPETRAKISAAGKGRIVSQETRAKMREINTGRKHTKESRLKMSEALTGVPRSESSRSKQRLTLQQCPWRNRSAKKDLWANADSAYNVFCDHPTVGEETFRKILGIPSSARALLHKFRDGWIPSEDANWLLFTQELKTIKEAECLQHTAS